MLGFEEGNLHPAEIRHLLANALTPRDLFLSEMQLLPKENWLPIFGFYDLPEMRRFSKITLSGV